MSQQGQKLLLENTPSVERDRNCFYRRLCRAPGTETVARKDSVIREVQQPLLHDTISFKRAKTVSRIGCVS